MLDPKMFPRPPRLEKIAKHVLVKWPDGPTIAETRNAYWVLETYHPPTYYIPAADVKVDMSESTKHTMCEWKGVSTYWHVTDPSTGQLVKDRVWSYDRPTQGFKPISGYRSFYLGPWECYVDDEKATAQPGRFYGGWITKDIKLDSVKGSPGTEFW